MEDLTRSRETNISRDPGFVCRYLGRCLWWYQWVAGAPCVQGQREL